MWECTRPTSVKSCCAGCDQCHTPVLAKTCTCGAPTREVPLTPPGDARPAFPADIALINKIYTEHFGAPLVH